MKRINGLYFSIRYYWAFDAFESLTFSVNNNRVLSLRKREIRFNTE